MSQDGPSPPLPDAPPVRAVQPNLLDVAFDAMFLDTSSVPTILATSGAPPTQKRQSRCPVLMMQGLEIASLLVPLHRFGVSRRCVQHSSRHATVYLTLLTCQIR